MRVAKCLWGAVCSSFFPWYFSFSIYHEAPDGAFVLLGVEVEVSKRRQCFNTALCAIDSEAMTRKHICIQNTPP